ncbi:serine/threonine-protein kinase [Mucilaginibacter sp. CSA2-8R]|uniref:serine/threonine protein kinase n=1 Tax=Mucilaginibacter sp. CSA2-8R TaxID=3141542 RepID=UPI00315CE8CD
MSKVFTIADGLENLGALRTGGQGSVYKGKRQGTLYSAIKLLPTPIISESEDDRGYRNFQNEVTKLQKVNEQPNPHVVKIRSFGLTDSGSFPFIEMEYIEGPDLCELLQPPHDPIFSLKELIKVANQLADALAHCYRVGVKHGDIKSNNVKYNVHTGNYVLLDFGLAILTDEQRRSSVRHAGAIEFMAPEQHEGEMLPQTDVYSYGVVLYELLTGQVPFVLNGNGETARNAVMLAHLEQAVPDPITRRILRLPAGWDEDKRKQELAVPQWLLQVITRCLEKDPARRYANGIELQQALTEGSLMAAESHHLPASARIDATALQEENERLQAELLQYRQKEEQHQNQLSSLQSVALEAGGRYNPEKGMYESNKDIVHLPKRWFVGLAGVAALFIALFSFSFFSKPKTPAGTEAAAVKVDENYKSPFVFLSKRYQDSVKAVYTKPAVKMAAFKPAEQQFVPPGWAKHHKKFKGKHRKRFLGLF